MISSRTKERLSGLFLFVIGSALTTYNWYTAFNFGYYKRLPLLGSLLAMGGLALLITSPYKIITAKSEETGGQYVQVKTVGNLWKALIIIGVFAFFLNWYLLATKVN